MTEWGARVSNLFYVTESRGSGGVLELSTVFRSLEIVCDISEMQTYVANGNHIY